jgi:hypothetical protein
VKWLSIVWQYLPTVIAAVAAIEKALQGAPGATKKQLILDAIQAGAKQGETVPESHIAGVSALIDQVVGTLNATGFFSHPPK